MTSQTPHDSPQPPATPPDRTTTSVRHTVGKDIAASLVVFLVALPLCIGVAVASGVPVELGIITGVVGGLVVGFLPGSTMQVSGPAAGLTVLVAQTVAQRGLGVLGVIVLTAGLLQLVMGLLRIGVWFRAISPSVVQGLLAGIGLVLILGQLYSLAGRTQPASTVDKFAGLLDLAQRAVTTAEGMSGLAVGTLTIAIIALWRRVPARVQTVPGALVAVVVASAVSIGFGLPLRRISVGSLADALSPPGASAFVDAFTPAVLGTILTFALIASAESLFSAAAVDRMHDAPKTQYNKELIAQGAGNTVCGLLGALPLTAVIVRSAANVHAGARTKVSRVLHGLWLLIFVVLLPGLLSYIPTAVLAALLIQAGWKLLELRQIVRLTRTNRPESALLLLTAILIVSTDLLIGTLTGLAAAVIKTAWDVSRLTVTTTACGHDHEHITLRGNATFLRLPRLLATLEQLPATTHVHIDLSHLGHLDRGCRQALDHWVAQHRSTGSSVEVVPLADTI